MDLKKATLFLSLLAVIGLADFKSVSANPTTGKVTAVSLVNFNKGWTGGEGWIAKTDDKGNNWKVQYKGTGTVNQLYSIDDQQAWAVISESSSSEGKPKLLKTSDGGKTWITMGPLPNNSYVHFISATEGFSGNAATTDGGLTWTTKWSPTNTVGEAFYFDSKHGWAVTLEKEQFRVVRTLDGGRTWKAVMTRKTEGNLTDAVIRSEGTDDAWVECIGDSGMSQTSYSLFHTEDRGRTWKTVLVNSTAGGGPAPGFPLDYKDSPKNAGSKPGPLFTVDTQTAYLGGYCPACDKPNTLGWTHDGGTTWTNGKAEFPGDAGALIGFSDARHGWWICSDNKEPSVLYTTSDGGNNWDKVHTFSLPN